MTYGISLHSIVPMRREPAHTSEMTSQLLFGELYRVLESTEKWLRISMSFDQYEGWISSAQATLIEEDEFIRMSHADTAYTLDLVQLLANEAKKIVLPVVIGSSLPGLEAQYFEINGEQYAFEGQVADSDILESASTPQERMDARNSMLQDALVYLNAPYMWGGRSPFGIDCSGFVQIVYKMKKISLMRDASLQATQGEIVPLLEEAEPCDLAFFDDEEGKITHVGMLIDRNRIIHASGKVRIDKIDHEGIYNEGEQRYTHRLRMVRRMV